MAYPKKHVTVEQFRQENFQEEGPVLYEILWNEVKYEILLNRNTLSSQAAVFGTGAITKEKPLPVFSRATWMDEIFCTGIWYFDPTVYLGETNIGWGYGTNERWYLEDIAALIQVILDKLNIATSKTLFFGSSGGGFTSIMLASMLGGTAMAINPQLNVESYYLNAVRSFKNAVLKPGEELITHRLDVASFIETTGNMPVIYLVENTSSQHDLLTQLPSFLEKLFRKGINCNGRVNVDFYTAEGGHNGMPSKKECLNLIQKGLDSCALGWSEDNHDDSLRLNAENVRIVQEQAFEGKKELLAQVTELRRESDAQKLQIELYRSQLGRCQSVLEQEEKLLLEIKREVRRLQGYEAKIDRLKKSWYGRIAWKVYRLIKRGKAFITKKPAQ